MSIRILVIEENRPHRTLEAEPGESLYETLARNGVALSAPCGGRGRCGKCKVQMKYADSDDSYKTVLACQTIPRIDCEVRLVHLENRILTRGQRTSFECDGLPGYVFSVDIGTTTVAGYLLDRTAGRQLAAVSCLNPQRIHGADVISRMSFAGESAGNRNLLQREILDLLEKMQADLLEKAGLPADTPIDSRSLVGNTAMMHLTGGFSTGGIACAPYLPEYSALHTQTLAKRSYILGGCISGYVGADTVGAMLACNLMEAEDTVLLIDIGTNGEIVLKSNGKYSCCSCAAGPAFEGAHIACGTGAVSGAIDHIKEVGGGFFFTTIDSAEPVGLCGSGLVDGIAYLLNEDAITPIGRMSQRFEISDRVYIDPADVREVQLAKAAIAAGIEILVNRAGIKMEEIDRVLLAGGFGNYIDVHSACTIGLLPIVLEKKVFPVGNAAGEGAQMMALSGKACEEAENLRKETNYIELSAQDDFEDIYTDNLIFEIKLK